jgi:SapC
MINPLLHRQPVPVDRERHRHMRVRWPVADWSVAARLNAIFIAAVEFGDTCRDYPVVFVRAGQGDDGKPLVAPIAVLGMLNEDNLFVEGTQWRQAGYLPAVLRGYPFGIARIDAERFAICIDSAWPGLNADEGEPLFGADGQPGPLLAQTQAQLEKLELEIQRTRLVCARLLELDLLRDMRFDATLPDGRKHTVDGEEAVDEARFSALPDATVIELHRQGLLGLVHAHWVSLGNMRKLLDWHVQRHAGTPAAAG